jgi:hypothetical protein
VLLVGASPARSGCLRFALCLHHMTSRAACGARCVVCWREVAVSVWAALKSTLCPCLDVDHVVYLLSLPVPAEVAHGVVLGHDALTLCGGYAAPTVGVFGPGHC